MRNPEWQIRSGLDRTVCCDSAATLRYWIACAVLCLLFIATAAAEPARSPTRPAPRNSEAEAATYDRCLKLAKQDPAAAQTLAQTWHGRGGAHPADHCARAAVYVESRHWLDLSRSQGQRYRRCDVEVVSVVRHAGESGAYAVDQQRLNRPLPLLSLSCYTRGMDRSPSICHGASKAKERCNREGCSSGRKPKGGRSEAAEFRTSSLSPFF